MSAQVSKKGASGRGRLIQLIHVAKRDLDMDDDSYRDALRSAVGKDSTSDMSIPELERVVSHMKRCGFKVRTKVKVGAPRKTAKVSRPLAQDHESKKIRALWLFLHELGAVQNPSEEALAGYVKRITKVDALQWITGEQAETLIETMKKWALRFLPQAVRDLVPKVAELPMTDQERMTLNNVLRTAFSAGTYDPMHSAWEALTHMLKKGGNA